jgi:hypothetical protein
MLPPYLPFLFSLVDASLTIISLFPLGATGYGNLNHLWPVWKGLFSHYLEISFYNQTHVDQSYIFNEMCYPGTNGKSEKDTWIGVHPCPGKPFPSTWTVSCRSPARNPGDKLFPSEALPENSLLRGSSHPHLVRNEVLRPDLLCWWPFKWDHFSPSISHYHGSCQVLTSLAWTPIVVFFLVPLANLSSALCKSYPITLLLKRCSTWPHNLVCGGGRRISQMLE